jgi:hypothetical protein
MPNKNYLRGAKNNPPNIPMEKALTPEQCQRMKTFFKYIFRATSKDIPDLLKSYLEFYSGQRGSRHSC